MRSIVLLLGLLGFTPAWADLLVVEFTGEVALVRGAENGGSLDHVRIGSAVSGTFIFDPDQFPLGSGDGSTFVAVRDPWEFPMDLLRSRVVIGDAVFPTEDPGFAYTLGTSLICDSTSVSRVCAGGRDAFNVNDWSSPLDLSDVSITWAPLRIVTLGAQVLGASDFVTPPVTSLHVSLDFSLATLKSLQVVEGFGERVIVNGIPTGTFAFDFDDPAHLARSAIVTVTSVAKHHCQNRIPWVDQGRPFPDHPVGCGVSQRPSLQD